MSAETWHMQREAWVKMVGPDKDIPMLMLTPLQLSTPMFEDGEVVKVELTIRPATRLKKAS